MRISGESVPMSEIRCQQAGDWTYGDDVINVKSAKLSDWRYELLVQVHELVEAVLCKHRGITDEEVTAFDELFEREREMGLHMGMDENGDDRRAPYRREHAGATTVEIFLAKELGVDWKKYSDEIYSLTQDQTEIPAIMSSQIKAKVSVYSVEDQTSGGDAPEKYAETVRMMPVTSDSEENKTFSDATPSGSIMLAITNKAAWGFFVEGKKYYVDFTPADAPAEAR